MFLDIISMSSKTLFISTCLLLLLSLLGCQSSSSQKLEFSDGSYEGKVNNDGQKHGFGIYRWKDGSIFEGDYANDLRHGNGRFLWANGESYAGDYLKDERTGKGIYQWPDRSSYDGEFLVGKRHGLGRFQSAQGIIYDGEWFDDMQHGQGTLSYPDGRKIKGIWRNGTLLSKPALLPKASQKPVLPKVEIATPDQANSTSLAPTNTKDAKPQDKDMTPEVSGFVHSPKEADSEPISEPSPPKVVAPLPTQSSLKQKPAKTKPPKAIIEEKGESFNERPEKEEELTQPDWTGTVAEAEAFFITELNDGIDTVRLRASGIPFSGRMRIVNQNGQAQGEVNLLNGRMHGDEIFYDESGKIVEKNYWANGRPVGR